MKQMKQLCNPSCMELAPLSLLNSLNSLAIKTAGNERGRRTGVLNLQGMPSAEIPLSDKSVFQLAVVADLSES